MARKRSNGEGTVRQRPDGRWEARLAYTDPITDETSRSSFYGSTEKLAKDKMRAALKRLEEGAPVKDATATVGAWIVEWLATSLEASTERKDSTKSLYRSLANSHLVPGPFGAVALDKLRPSHVERLVLALRAKGLADSTVRSTYTVARAALNGAVRDGLLARNPALVVKRPKVGYTEARHLSPAEVVALLSEAKSSPHYPALALLAATGLRRGEALALKWKDLDLEVGVLEVNGTLSRSGGQLVTTRPKTERSRRTVPLSPSTVALLKATRQTQREQRMRAANIWTDTGYVFTTPSGQPVDPRNLFRSITLAARKAGLHGVGLHTLRHSAATAWLDGSVNIKAVSDLLGHSSISITGDIYGHTSDASARAAITLLSDAIGL